MDDNEQLEFPLGNRPQKADVDLSIILKKKSFTSAINFCMDVSGLEPKEIYLPLEIDQGHFSNIRNGKANYPLDKLTDLMRLCNNDIPLQWLAHARGYGLVTLRSELERQLEEERAKRIEAEKQLQTILDYEAAKAGRR